MCSRFSHDAFCLSCVQEMYLTHQCSCAQEMCLKCYLSCVVIFSFSYATYPGNVAENLMSCVVVRKCAWNVICTGYRKCAWNSALHCTIKCQGNAKLFWCKKCPYHYQVIWIILHFSQDFLVQEFWISSSVEIKIHFSSLDSESNLGLRSWNYVLDIISSYSCISVKTTIKQEM